MSPRRSPAGPLRPALVALALATACADRGREVVVERTELLLVEELGRMRVLEQNERRPVDVGVVEPGVTTSDAGPLPAVRMTPPAAVEFDLGGLPEDAVLHFALGFEPEAYEVRGPHPVRFEVALDGEPVDSRELFGSARVPLRDRAWTRGSVALGGAGRVRLSTDYAGDLETPPPAAFGLLEVTAPFRTRRRPSRPSAPNVVLFLVDTLRADRLGAYGGPAGLTPVLDGLAARGTVWERCYAPAPWTWPSTATLLTGLTPPEHGVEGIGACFLAHELTTLAERFQAEELRTAGFSTNVLIRSERNFDQGFEDFHEDDWATADELLPEVEAWLREADGDRFFLYVHLTDPHTPYAPPADLAAELVDDPPPGWTAGETWNTVLRRLKGQRHDDEAIRAAAGHDLELYDAEIANLDRRLGGFLDVLAELGLDDRTLVCVTSDHGEEFFDHGMYHHTKQLYEEVLHVPLLLAGPGVEAGRRVPGTAALQAVGATLLDAAGLAPGFGRSASLLTADGGSAPVFVGSEVGWWFDDDREELLMQEEPLYGVVDGDVRFQWGRGAGDAPRDLVRLFDVGRDPEQREDLSDERAADVRRYRESIEAWLTESRLRRPRTFSEDAGVMEMLRELGYAGIEDPEEPAGAPAGPRED